MGSGAGATGHESGTKWRIWDLHVHTPSSLVSHYGGDTEATWERFFEDLEALPDDVRVVGINDYWFLDGYKKVLAARAKGRLQNLDAIFPVLELRLEQFGGTTGQLARVNLHIIFDPDLAPELIEAQFINALTPGFRLAPHIEGITWQSVITRESLEELGKAIKASVPEAELPRFDSDLMEGFNNLNISFQQVTEILRRPHFEGKVLIGIGKAEWAKIKWNEQSIAAKKHIINSANFIFTAFRDTATWPQQVDKLRAAMVNHKILDCSDAHYFSDSTQNERIGRCQTWLNTTPTLAGLAHALEEFDHRVHVGLEPPSLGRVRKHPEHFIAGVRISSNNPSEHPVFDYALELNPGFVAVVGNKGQGKSALLDCIAVAGNSSRSSEFAFLTEKRFLSPGNKPSAREYFSELTWASATKRRASLADNPDSSAPIYVEYLPQAFIERVCNADPASSDAEAFERELREILFTHIPEEDRAGAATFDALQQQKTRPAEVHLDRLRGELSDAIARYVECARFRADNTTRDVEAKIALKQKEIESALLDRTTAQQELGALDSSSRADEELDALRASSIDIEQQIAQLFQTRAENERTSAIAQSATLSMESVMQRVRGLREDIAQLNAEAAQIAEEFTETSPLLTFEVHEARYETWRAELNDAHTSRHAEHAHLTGQIDALEARKTEIGAKLAALDSTRELARRKLTQANERLRGLIGNDGDTESRTGLEVLRDRIQAAPDRLAEARKALLQQAGLIHEALSSQLDDIEALCEPAMRFVVKSDAIKKAELQFKAELRILPSWRNATEDLDHRRNSDFPEWLEALPARTEKNEWSEISPQLDVAIQRLETERGGTEGQYRDPATALKSSADLGAFLAKLLNLTWLEVRIGLTGDGLPLTQLSPGQRGLMLALFYLVVDRRTTPLLLDQPEENLDNETIASLLVPAIREAAARRQTIVVTHNANLAVVGDADQIIHCQSENRNFTVSSGCISEIDVARFTVNVLEGTKNAFDNRRSKYEVFPAL